MNVSVNPNILVWARETAGLGVDDATKKLQLTDSAKSTAVEKLNALENGEKQPTKSQLNNMCKTYNRPLLVFYMAEPPAKRSQGIDFRQNADARSVWEDAILDAFLRNIIARQETVRILLEDDDDFSPPNFVESITIEQGAEYAVSEISRILDFDLRAQRLNDPDALFKQLREKVEAIGVFVLVLGNLGSFHTNIPSKVFRGFTIADRIAPFIVINPNDARSAWAFTLIHELTHIFLGQTGVSGAASADNPTTNNSRIERFCNDVAGEFLLPEQALRQRMQEFSQSDIDTPMKVVKAIARERDPRGRKHIDTPMKVVKAIAYEWSVSEPMVAYRLNRMSYLEKDAYKSLCAEFCARWEAQKDRDRDKKEDDHNMIDPNIIKRSRLGDALIKLVYRNVRNNTLSQTKAAIVLGGKLSAVESFLKHFESVKKDHFVFKKKKRAK